MTIIGDIMYIILPLVDLVDVLAFVAFDLSCLLLQGGVRVLLVLLVKSVCLLFLFGCKSLFRSVLRESIRYLYVRTCNLVFLRCTINKRHIMYIILPLGATVNCCTFYFCLIKSIQSYTKKRSQM
jgi:hypothetical protein